MYNDTITLFNRYAAVDGDTWYPTVIRNVNLNIDRAEIIAKYGAQSSDNVILNIRYSFDGENKVIAEKQWKPSKAWGKLPDNELGAYLTFKGGTLFDFFYVGEWDETPIPDSDYKNGFYNYMNEAFDNVFAINSVGLYSVIPHFEILGK